MQGREIASDETYFRLVAAGAPCDGRGAVADICLHWTSVQAIGRRPPRPGQVAQADASPVKGTGAGCCAGDAPGKDRHLRDAWGLPCCAKLFCIGEQPRNAENPAGPNPGPPIAGRPMSRFRNRRAPGSAGPYFVASRASSAADGCAASNAASRFSSNSMVFPCCSRSLCSFCTSFRSMGVSF